MFIYLLIYIYLLFVCLFIITYYDYLLFISVFIYLFIMRDLLFFHSFNYLCTYNLLLFGVIICKARCLCVSCEETIYQVHCTK